MISEGDVLTDSEKQEIRDVLGYGSNIPDTKQNVHTFLFNVATADDTTKLGNLIESEIGTPSNPIRSFKHLGLFAGEIMNREELAKYFRANSEIVTSTSLSRAGFLVDRAVLQKREMKDATTVRKENKGWFKKKENNEEGGVQQ
jgi:hypothetical protein